MILTDGDHDLSVISSLSDTGLAITISFDKQHHSKHTGTQVFPEYLFSHVAKLL